jgi:hypothetical protein
MALPTNAARFVLTDGERTVTRDQILQAMASLTEKAYGTKQA